jgi:FtsP/CotA-like multicopper oxidase with cupredoxin domain
MTGSARSDRNVGASTLFSRRRILAGAGIAVACTTIGTTVHGGPGDPDAAKPDGFRVIRARPGTAALRGADAGTAEIWGYDGAAPGPLLRVTRGAEVKVRLVNELPEPTCVHWHGVRIANPMDGVPGLTQPPIAPGASFDYRFIAPDAGTYWYHPPHDFPAQLSRGLAGALVVEEPTPVEVDRDVALVLSDWRLKGDGAIDAAGGSPRPPHLTVNGMPRLDIAMRGNERLRLRLVNASFAHALVVRVERHQAVVMAVDGEPAEPFLARRGRIALGPGNRIDLFIDATLAPGDSAPIVAETPGGEMILARLAYDGAPPARATPRPDPKPLPANPLPERIDLTRALKLEVPLERSGAGAATAGGPPLFSLRRGRAVMLGFANRADADLVVHVHGHHFRLLDRLDDGWKPFWLDTLLVPAGQSEHIAFVADNPGKWRINAHLLEPAGARWTRWFEVT